MNEVAGRKPLDPAALLGQVWSDRYRLDSVLGAGGMAIVYAATDRDGTRVAIKVLRAEVAADATVCRLFAREGKLANRVAHAGAPKIVDEGVTEEGLPFLVQTLIDGETVLARARREGGKLRAAEVLEIADQALEVLAVAHDAGVVHRDVKPSNLMVGPAGEVYVLDFGLARHSASGTATSSAVVGTPAFMAPEQGIPGGRVDARADFFSVGATVLHLLTGGPVRAGELPSELPLSPPLRQWLSRAIAVDPSVRWTNVAAMRAELRGVFRSVIGEPLENPRAVILGAWLDSGSASAETREGSAVQSRTHSGDSQPTSGRVAIAPGGPRHTTVLGSGSREMPVATLELDAASVARASVVPRRRDAIPEPNASPGAVNQIAPRLPPGAKFGRYTVGECIGSGGMGEVYRAQDDVLERIVALKLVRRDSVLAPNARERLLREARAAAAIQHPNAVTVHEAGENAGTPYLAMELVIGRTLRSLIGDESRSLAERLGWLIDIAHAIHAAHEKGIVHRDLKPENVMLNDAGIIKVLDFGIAQRWSINADAPLTLEGMVVGSPRYMAPEQLRGDALDGRADQFAWGVLAYELLTGRAPWESLIVPELFACIADGRIVPFGASVPPPLSRIVRRALSARREDRFDSFRDVVRELEAIDDASLWNRRGASGLGRAIERRLLRPLPAVLPTRFLVARAKFARILVVFGLIIAPMGVNWGLRRARSRDLSAPSSPVETASVAPGATVVRSRIPAAQSEFASALHRLRGGSVRSARVHFAKAADLDPELSAARLLYVLFSDYADADVHSEYGWRSSEGIH